MAHEAACAEDESALRLREVALTERERALEEAEAAAQRLADSLFLREAAQEEQARRNLDGARAERAALGQRAAELEARAKELDARARSGGVAAGDGDLAARLAATEHTIIELQGTAPRLAFALDSDTEGGDDGADDSGDEAGDLGASERAPRPPPILKTCPSSSEAFGPPSCID